MFKPKQAQNTERQQTIRINYKCDGGIGKSIPRITVQHHESCRGIANGDPEGRIFLSHSHMTK